MASSIAGAELHCRQDICLGFFFGGTTDERPRFRGRSGTTPVCGVFFTSFPLRAVCRTKLLRNFSLHARRPVRTRGNSNADSSDLRTTLQPRGHRKTSPGKIAQRRDCYCTSRISRRTSRKIRSFANPFFLAAETRNSLPALWCVVSRMGPPGKELLPANLAHSHSQESTVATSFLHIHLPVTVY